MASNKIIGIDPKRQILVAVMEEMIRLLSQMEGGRTHLRLPLSQNERLVDNLQRSAVTNSKTQFL